TEVDVASWDHIYAVNLRSVGLTAKHVVPLMAPSGRGSIVNIASVNAVVGRPNMGQYDAMKAGVVSLTRTMACELADRDIRVNSLLPAGTHTDFHIRRAAEQGLAIGDEVMERHEGGPGLLKRKGRPEEIAYAALFLASDESSFFTGSSLFPDGGMSV